MDTSSLMPRRSLLIIVCAILPFCLTVFGSYFISTFTRDGRLAMWIIFHSQTMTDSEIARAIGRNPFEVLRNAGLMAKSVPVLIVLLMGTLVACFERKSPGKIAALVLTPYFLWDFSMSAFSTVRAPWQAASYAAKVLGVDAFYTAVAVITAILVVRIWKKSSGLRDAASA